MGTTSALLVSCDTRVWVVDPERGTVTAGRGLDGVRASPLAAHPRDPGRAWCGTRSSGVFSSEDGGVTWRRSGLRDHRVTALAASPSESDLVWAGTEPSMLWRSEDGGSSWRRVEGLQDLPSSDDWAFPPRPETHHVRWIASHPSDADRLWLAIEAGALITTHDGGRTWKDRVEGGPRDTHELALHPARPGTLRVAAGDGYFESLDGGNTWSSPRQGIEAGYLRSVALDPGDPETVVVSAASSPRSAYRAGHSDGRLYRRVGEGSWARVTDGWPEAPSTIAPLLASGHGPAELWAADERGIHRSTDGGRAWALAAGFSVEVERVDGLALLADPHAEV